MLDLFQAGSNQPVSVLSLILSSLKTCRGLTLPVLAVALLVLGNSTQTLHRILTAQIGTVMTETALGLGTTEVMIMVAVAEVEVPL